MHDWILHFVGSEEYFGYLKLIQCFPVITVLSTAEQKMLSHDCTVLFFV